MKTVSIWLELVRWLLAILIPVMVVFRVVLSLHERDIIYLPAGGVIETALVVFLVAVAFLIFLGSILMMCETRSIKLVTTSPRNK